MEGSQSRSADDYYADLPPETQAALWEFAATNGDDATAESLQKIADNARSEPSYTEHCRQAAISLTELLAKDQDGTLH